MVLALLKNLGCDDVQGTYYGSGSNSAGACSLGSQFANTLDQPWTSGVKTFIAMNDQQVRLLPLRQNAAYTIPPCYSLTCLQACQKVYYTA